MDSFNGMTCHWINLETHEHESRLLDCSEFKESHTAENMKDEFVRVFDIKYNLKRKRGFSVCDNANNVKAAMRLYGVPRLSCFGHDINLVFVYAKDRSPVVIELRNKLAELVTITKTSGKLINHSLF